ncbi:MAG: hypothetical protein BRC26_04020 [Nanohaloarchaea archaeon QH_8_44_6]|nr:MAG: hypothetical protein BRC26_04020 [Nanohaloarchaea archaeon QH_8_44_6]
MYINQSLNDKLENGRVWLEYKSFEDNSYGVLFKDVCNVENYPVDMGKVDFKNREIVSEWFYTSSEEKKEAEEAKDVFSSLLEQNFLEGREGWKHKTRLTDDMQVSYSVIDAAPYVGGQVLKEDQRNIDKKLDNFSEGVFDPSLSSLQSYESIWVEGENVFS